MQPPTEVRRALEHNLDALGVLDRMERRFKELDDDLIELRGYLRRGNASIVRYGWPKESRRQQEQTGQEVRA